MQIRALVDSEAGVRTGAAWSLGSLGKSAEERGASVALLHRSLKDEDAQVRGGTDRLPWRRRLGRCSS